MLRRTNLIRNQLCLATKKTGEQQDPPSEKKITFLFNSDLFSDVKFVVRKANSENDSKGVIPAHTFVLSIGSTEVCI